MKGTRFKNFFFGLESEDPLEIFPLSLFLFFKAEFGKGPQRGLLFFFFLKPKSRKKPTSTPRKGFFFFFFFERLNEKKIFFPIRGQKPGKFSRLCFGPAPPQGPFQRPRTKIKKPIKTVLKGKTLFFLKGQSFFLGASNGKIFC